MAGMRELKKHLHSVSSTSQLAGAMKTVSSAKFSRVNRIYSGYRMYSESCGELISAFGPALSRAYPQTNPSSPVCVAVVASNRGLCGGYNSSLLSFAEEYLESLKREGREYRIVSCSKMTAAYFAERGVTVAREFILPDVPEYGDCGELMDYLRESYTSGVYSGVEFVYQHFKNTLTQIPSVRRILPMSAEKTADVSEPIYIPDKETVMKNACLGCIDSMIYSVILEAATGAQAATLMAMREASDNAEETIAALEVEISRKRQSEVTSGVIETYTPREENQ